MGKLTAATLLAGALYCGYSGFNSFSNEEVIAKRIVKLKIHSKEFSIAQQLLKESDAAKLLKEIQNNKALESFYQESDRLLDSLLPLMATQRYGFGQKEAQSDVESFYSSLKDILMSIRSNNKSYSQLIALVLKSLEDSNYYQLATLLQYESEKRYLLNHAFFNQMHFSDAQRDSFRNAAAKSALIIANSELIGEAYKKLSSQSEQLEKQALKMPKELSIFTGWFDLKSRQTALLQLFFEQKTNEAIDELDKELKSADKDTLLWFGGALAMALLATLLLLRSRKKRDTTSKKSKPSSDVDAIIKKAPKPLRSELQKAYKRLKKTAHTKIGRAEKKELFSNFTSDAASLALKLYNWELQSCSQSEGFDLSMLLSSLCEEYESIEPFVAPQIPSALNGKSKLLRYVLDELLQNSAKHGNKRRLEVSVKRYDDEELTLKFEVINDGRGFEDSISVVEPFGYKQAIGLALVERTLREHNSKLLIENLPNEGATVSFTLSFGYRQLTPEGNGSGIVGIAHIAETKAHDLERYLSYAGYSVKRCENDDCDVDCLVCNGEDELKEGCVDYDTLDMCSYSGVIAKIKKAIEPSGKVANDELLIPSTKKVGVAANETPVETKVEATKATQKSSSDNNSEPDEILLDEEKTKKSSSDTAVSKDDLLLETAQIDSVAQEASSGEVTPKMPKEKGDEILNKEVTLEEGISLEPVSLETDDESQKSEEPSLEDITLEPHENSDETLNEEVTLEESISLEPVALETDDEPQKSEEQSLEGITLEESISLEPLALEADESQMSEEPSPEGISLEPLENSDKTLNEEVTLEENISLEPLALETDDEPQKSEALSLEGISLEPLENSDKTLNDEVTLEESISLEPVALETDDEPQKSEALSLEGISLEPVALNSNEESTQNSDNTASNKQTHTDGNKEYVELDMDLDISTTAPAQNPIEDQKEFVDIFDNGQNNTHFVLLAKSFLVEERINAKLLSELEIDYTIARDPQEVVRLIKSGNYSHLVSDKFFVRMLDGINEMDIELLLPTGSSKRIKEELEAIKR